MTSGKATRKVKKLYTQVYGAVDGILVREFTACESTPGAWERGKRDYDGKKSPHGDYHYVYVEVEV